TDDTQRGTRLQRLSIEHRDRVADRIDSQQGTGVRIHSERRRIDTNGRGKGAARCGIEDIDGIAFAGGYVEDAGRLSCRTGRTSAGGIENSTGGSGCRLRRGNGGALGGYVAADVDSVEHARCSGRGGAELQRGDDGDTDATGRRCGCAAGSAVRIDRNSDWLLVDTECVDRGCRIRSGNRSEIDRGDAVRSRVGDDRDARERVARDTV